MSVDFRKLKSFVKIVDAGSLSRASSILSTAQPALSQQIAALEAHFKQKLLIRSSTGIMPTDAGNVLYRHAQIMLRQIEQAQVDVERTVEQLSGRVSVGLATYSLGNRFVLPFLERMADKHPDIIVHVNNSFGYVLSELIMTGKMDMAVIYGSGAIKGVEMTPLYRQELFLLAPSTMPLEGDDDAPLSVSSLAELRLILPSRGHFMRRSIDEAFMRARCAPRVVAELESATSLVEAVEAGLGATILPHAAIEAAAGSAGLRVRALVRPAITTTVFFCASDHLPLSEPAKASRAVLMDVLRSVLSEAPKGIHILLPQGRS